MLFFEMCNVLQNSYAEESLDNSNIIDIIDAFIEEYIGNYGISIYTGELHKWVYDTGESNEYMERIIQEGYDTDDYSFERHIQAAQYAEMYEVVSDMLDKFIEISKEDY
jgi:hypothetical protein